MNAIVGEAVVSCYVDAASFLVILLLLLLSERIRKRPTMSMRIFHLLSLCVMAICVFPFICNAMYLQPAPWCHTVAVAAKTLREIFVVFIVVLWLTYVDYQLYGGRKHRPLHVALFLLPLGLILVLLLVNPFTGVLFRFSADNRFEPRRLMYVVFALEFLYFCSSAAIVRWYDRKSNKIRFLRISPMIVSVVLASSTQFFAPYDIGVLGYVMGITLLYFSMVSEMRFVDEETGLRNKGYLAYLFDLAVAGKNDTRSALILRTEGDLPSAVKILHDVLHQNGDVIRVEEKKFLMFSDVDSRSTIQYLSSLVDEAVEKHNAERPDQKVQISTRCRMRTGSEDAFTFLRTVMDEKEAGDTMRGIVSMMSELDRLDKELKLAADIQLSVLPLNFPAFPDHDEFDLYASMTPAKEVGGDFFDFFLIDDDHLALIIADVSGKGIPAALFMMVSKTLIKNQLLDGCGPAETLEKVNVQLCERNSSMMFVTVWLAVVELSTGLGAACNAGHEKPAVRRNGGAFELLDYRHDMLVGVSKKAKYHPHEFQLSPGDTIFVYTDGVPEATNSTSEEPPAHNSDRMFGEQRLVTTLNEDPGATPEALITRVHKAVDAFAAGVPQFDDITMLCFKLK